MNWTDLCLSSRANQLLRWQQAFPSGRIFASLQQVTPLLQRGTLVWLHADAVSEPQLGEMVAEIRRVYPEQRLVVISCMPSQTEALAALQAGAAGYCHALATPEMLQQVALVVRNGGIWVGPELMNRLIGGIGQNLSSAVTANRSPVLEKLSPREQAVALQVGAGASNKEIAEVLKITERTVKAHLGAIFQKLGIRDRLQLALLISQEDQAGETEEGRWSAAT